MATIDDHLRRLAQALRRRGLPTGRIRAEA
jgi:hypothetical protein